MNHLKQVCLATQNYENVRLSLPVGVDNGCVYDEPWAGWRIKGHTAQSLLLPYIEESAVAGQYDYLESRALREEVLRTTVSIYVCPSDDAGGRMWRGSHSRSNYVVCMGSKTMLRDGANHHLVDCPWPRGVDVYNDGAFRIGQAVKSAQVRDGLSKTVLYCEVLSGKADGAGAGKQDWRGVWSIHPMGASSYTHRYLPNSKNGDSNFRGINCVGFSGAPCGDAVQPTKWEKEYASARSRHPGGVIAAFADGHVEFVSDAVGERVWWAKATISGGEVAQ